VRFEFYCFYFAFLRAFAPLWLRILCRQDAKALRASKLCLPMTNKRITRFEDYLMDIVVHCVIVPLWLIFFLPLRLKGTKYHNVKYCTMSTASIISKKLHKERFN